MEMSTWSVVGFFAFFPLLVVTLGVTKFLFLKETPDDQKFVTRAELRSAIDGIKVDLKVKLQEMDEYNHQTAHNNANIFHQINLKMERLLAIEESHNKPKEK